MALWDALQGGALSDATWQLSFHERNVLGATQIPSAGGGVIHGGLSPWGISVQGAFTLCGRHRTAPTVPCGVTTLLLYSLPVDATLNHFKFDVRPHQSNFSPPLPTGNESAI